MNPFEVIFEKEFETIFRNIGGEEWQDLRQEVALVLLEYDKDKLNEIVNRGKNDLRFWIVRVSINQVTTNGRFLYKMKEFSKYVKFIYLDDFARFHSVTEEPEESFESKIEKANKINEKLKTLEWYDQRIFSLYLEKGSVRKVAIQVGIPPTSIFNTIKKVKKCLKQSLS